MHSNFKVSRLACWNESKKGLARNSGNPESDNGSELAVIFSKEPEVSYKRKVQICGQLWKPDRGARSWAWSTICNAFLHFPSVSHRDQMKEMKESEIKYYRNNFFHLGEGNLLEDFCIVAVEAFGVCFAFFLFVCFCFFNTSHPKGWKNEQKKQGEEA